MNRVFSWIKTRFFLQNKYKKVPYSFGIKQISTIFVESIRQKRFKNIEL